MCITDANRQEREWGISDHIFPLDIHSLQLCFSSLWLELITAASPVLHEREESWRYLSVVVQNKMRKWGKEDRIAFRGQWMLSEQSRYLLKKYESVLYVVPPEINNISTGQCPEMYSAHIEWREKHTRNHFSMECLHRKFFDTFVNSIPSGLFINLLCIFIFGM